MALNISYASINLGSSMLWFFINGWLLYYYLPPGKDSGVLAVTFFTVAMFISRSIDIFVDLPIGHLSDHTSTRWGRRLPYIFLSSCAMPFLFIFLWLPSQNNDTTISMVLLTLLLLLFNLSYSTQQIPYKSLLPELSTSEKHRLELSAWQMGAQLLGAILASMAGWFIEFFGYLKTATLYAIGSLPLMLLPFLVLREQYQKSIVISERINLITTLEATVKNRSFMLFIITSALCWMSSTIILETIPFIVTQICAASESDTIYFYIPAVLITFLCFPFITWLANRFDKWNIFAASLALSAIVLPSMVLIGNWLPIPLIAQGIIWIILESVAISGAQVLPPAIIADITDKDYLLTGQRNEGLYYAAWSLAGQIASIVAAVIVPVCLLLGRSRFDPYGPLGVKVLSVLGGFSLLIAFLISRSKPKEVHQL